MIKPLISIESVSKSFGDLKVLKDISATVKRGEVVSILGPSGSGKSTLLRCINLLETPSLGTITILDEEITHPKCDIRKMRTRIGMVFQHFHLFPHFSVLENVAYSPHKVKNESASIVEKRAYELLERVGLSDKAHTKPHNLSGGQKQRVAIARTLAMEPEVILFDEPTSALDPEMVKEVLDVIKSLVHTNITILIVTHEMSFAREVSDTIWFLDEGRLIEKNTPDAFFTQPQEERAQSFLAKVL